MENAIEHWVAEAPADRKLFAQAVHIILHAIADSEYLRTSMIMKGGMLLGIRYLSSRYTEDIDFSTAKKLASFDKDEFTKKLSESLMLAADHLPYQVTCKVQSLKVQPNIRATFPTIKLKIGYAFQHDKASLKRLDNGQSPHTVKIDYSFNEGTYHPEPLILEDEESVMAYGFVDLIAEKLRSVIQQVVRGRERRQDIYDLYYLLRHCDSSPDDEKYAILDALHKKSVGRLNPEMLAVDTLQREDIKKASKADYENLKDEIDGPLPDFETTYQEVRAFYESLPWGIYQVKEESVDPG
jgi:predicted nucleotidyltransferase component of viral defense system